MMQTTRRTFLKASAGGAAVLTFGGIAPQALRAAAARNQSDRVLVVIELQGGNDGLNTVIPADHDTYRRLRPKLGIRKSDVLSINDELGFHPALTGFASLLESRQLTIVQGVGYENPNRSHFESMDIWHTCQRKNEVRSDGWLGRWIEQAASRSGNDPVSLHLGADKQPFALMARTVRTPSIRSLDQFRLQGVEDPDFRKAINEILEVRREAGNDLLDFVQTSTSSALAASERLNNAALRSPSTAIWPRSPLAEQLRTVSGLIRTGLQTSVYYVTFNGFDTHSQQPDVHSALLRQLGDAVKTFIDDLNEGGLTDRVVVMCFSEFGRRVQENASDGTDHGTAGPMFLAGAAVQSGLAGAHPDLTRLQDGDLQFHTDFRQVYAAIIEHWFRMPSKDILHGEYAPVDVFRDRA